MDQAHAVTYIVHPLFKLISEAGSEVLGFNVTGINFEARQCGTKSSSSAADSRANSTRWQKESKEIKQERKES